MRSTTLVATLVCLCVVPLAGLWSAEGDPGAGAAALAISTIPPTGATAAIRGERVNIRFAPNRAAKQVCLLSGGAVVELKGRVPAAQGWWAIRFPREGRAWVYTANLAAVEGNLLKVTRDGTRAREDATLGAPIVRELALGEILESRGATVAQWSSVWIPNATAYVHESVLTLGSNVQGILEEVQARNALADQEWQDAAKLYLDLYREVQGNLSRATSIDWAPLTARLDRVIATHPDGGVRLQASAIKSGVGEVQRAAAGLGGTPVPAQPVTPTPGTVLQVEAPIAKPKLPVPTAEQMATVAQVPPKPKYPGQGILETHDYPQLGAAHHLINANGQVVAILKSADGSAVAFSEFVWREVGAQGTVTVAEPAATGLAKPVPVIAVTDLVLAR